MKQRKILVVEDDNEILETIRYILEVEGYEVFTAKNGKDALEGLRKSVKPSLIFLDLMMPVMNGQEFLNALKNNNTIQDQPIVAITATVGDKIKLDGVVAVLHKPIEITDLLEAAQKYCGLS